MSDLAIRVDSLGKQYRIGAPQGAYRYKSLRESLTGAFTAPFRGLFNSQFAIRNSQSEVIWALKDVSFEIQPGEVVGVIGRNGAGKSTLLKILSRITEPTEGRAEVRGRVGSLLEVGTGFHPELSGRENIYLSGAVLGMRRAEIEQKFDDIVSFAEVEKFVDTPVKHYSSGMYVRLAFAVAAHLEPEVLLVDEVLAVGDLQFQKKCFGAMRDSVAGGKTVLLVSHNMAAISQLCRTSVWLDGGCVRAIGETRATVAAYLQSSEGSVGTGMTLFPEDVRKAAQLRQIRLLNGSKTVTQTFHCDEPIILELTLQVNRRVPGLYGYLDILTGDGVRLLSSYSHDVIPNPLDELPVGAHTVQVTVPPRVLGHGEYKVYLSFAAGSGGSQVDTVGVISTFTVDDLTTKVGNNRVGFLSTLLSWRACGPVRQQEGRLA